MSKNRKNLADWKKVCVGVAIAASAMTAGLEHMTVLQPQLAPPACVQVTYPVAQQLA
jgi:hypothetical protein